MDEGPTTAMPEPEPVVATAAPEPAAAAEPDSSRRPFLPGPSQDSIDLTADSDGEQESVPTPQIETPSAPPQQSVQVGLNGIPNQGPSANVNFDANMNGYGNGHGHPQPQAQAGPSSAPAYPSYFSNGPLQRPPIFGIPGYKSHPPNGNTNGSFHPPFQRSFPSYSNGNGNSNGNGHGNGSAHFQSPYAGSSTIYSPRQHPPAGPSNDGFTSTSAIDLTSNSLPSPSAPHNPKKPVFIGAVTTDIFMLYPCPVVFIGAPAPDDREFLDVVNFRGAEFLKVKLKFRQAGAIPKRTDQWESPKRDVIQVMTPGMTQYIGELAPAMADLLCSHMSRGLLRLEGFAMRIQHDAHKYSIRVNIMMFTLPANITYIASTLQANNIYLLDPIPPYDPYRHADTPPYQNPHGGGQISAAAAQRAQAMLAGASGQYGNFVAQERINQVDVQRRQVDEVYTTIETGGELEQSDPGPLIKTELFPHQRKALTFLLQREQDWSSLKKARKYFDKATKKKLKNLNKAKEKGKGKEAQANGEAKEGEARDGDVQDGEAKEGEAKDGDEENKDVDGDRHEDTKESTPAADEEDKGKARDISRSLWEPHKDDKGRIKMWKNKITAEEIKVKKGDKPPDCKGAILADDMGLGKTLSIVSLIAATKRAAKKWSKTELVVPSAPTDTKPELDPSTIKTKVFGMPDVPEPDDKGKKRKRDLEEVKTSIPLLKSRGTLLVCPMSTISNWEDQIREHWNGNVQVVGGASGQMLKPAEKKWKVPKRTNASSSDEDEDDFDTLRIYIYHGPSRCSDPEIIADFDIVITSYNTLANEYSKSNASCEDTPVDTAQNSDGDGDEEMGDTSLNSRAVKPEVEAEIKAIEVAEALRKKKKGPKGLSVKASEKSPLQSIQWFRVALDEAHYIKTASTVASRAACAVDADRRIALTGTPIQNKIEDIWALFKFLRLHPIDEKDQFTKYISAPCKIGSQVGVARLQLVMRCCTLRRTKDSTAEDGRKILNLPLRKESQMWLELREDERAIYDARHAQGKAELENFQQEEVGSRNYAHVLQQILRLRQTCNHVDLAQMDPVEEDYDGTIMDYEVAVAGINAHGLNQNRGVSVVCFMKDGQGANCAECNYDYNDYFPSLAMTEIEESKPKKKMPTPLLLTKCLHIYCPKCFKGSVHPGWTKRMKETAARACGICQQMLRLPHDVVEIVPPDSAEAQVPTDQPKRKRKRYVRPPGEKPNLSTKMQFLYDELMSASKKNPNSKNYDPFAIALNDEPEELDESGRPFVVKSVVFSQWTTMLDRIGDMLEEAQIRYARLDGTMTREDRAKACDDLRYNKKVEILLVSTRAGGVGLNLTAASRCFLVDPYWNPSVEAQAIDRIHRMGQTRPVIAIKLMINNSVEQRLHKLQQKKANLAQISLNKLSRKDLMNQKAEELAELFK